MTNKINIENAIDIFERSDIIIYEVKQRVRYEIEDRYTGEICYRNRIITTYVRAHSIFEISEKLLSNNKDVISIKESNINFIDVTI